MNRKANDLIIPFIGLLVVVIIFLLLIMYTFEDKPYRECIFPAEVDCIAYQTTNDTQNSVSLQLINNLHEDINISRANIVDSTCSYSITPLVNATKIWPKDTVLWLSFDCKQVTSVDGLLTINVDVRTHVDKIPLRFTGKVRVT